MLKFFRFPSANANLRYLWIIFPTFSLNYLSYRQCLPACSRITALSGNKPHEIHKWSLCWFLKLSLTSRVLLLTLKSNCFSFRLNLGLSMYSAVLRSSHFKMTDLECLVLKLFEFFRKLVLTFSLTKFLNHEWAC